MVRRAVVFLSVAFALIWMSAQTRAGQSSPRDFTRDIEPILADHCYQCHGPDPGGRKANLRLDQLSSATHTLKDGKIAVVRSNPAQSEMIRRVTSSDPDVHMPPAPHEALNAQQIETLREWIAQGAPYRGHWSFEKPVRPAVPSVKQKDWPKTPIDHFVLAALESQAISPSPPASKSALIRRVTLDLTGLLPTPDEVTAFEKDTSPSAYEALVDRLLASPRFGEQRAHYWLDYVRYGDTHGLHNDDYRDIWPYRDYVVRAFNSNKPYDQFATEQIAGDLLPPTNVDQLVATGFIRCNLSTGEGGAINEELRVNNARDRTEAFGTVFMGMTVGCAVCHDHKFDPITQKDFYSLSAFFNNLNERPSNDDRFDYPPAVRVPKPEHLAEYNDVLAQKAKILRKIERRKKNENRLIQQWLTSDNGPKAVSEDGLQLRLRLDEQNGTEVRNSAPGAKPEQVSFTGSAPVWGEQTWLWPALRLQANSKLELKSIGDFEKDQPFSAGGWVRVRFNPTGIGDVTTGTVLSRMDSAHGSRGWELAYDKALITVRLVHALPANAIVVQSTSTVSRGNWHHLFFTYDGSGKAAGVKIYSDGRLMATKVLSDKLTDSIHTDAPWELSRRFDSDALKMARFQDVRVYGRALSDDEVARLPYEDYAAEIAKQAMNRWNADQRYVVSHVYWTDFDAKTKELRSRLKPLDQKLAELSKGGDDSLICQELPEPAYAHVLSRGVYTARLARVSPNVPEFLPPLAPGEPHNRLGLAHWVTSAENPLTARVEVNRMWQELFGVGLVSTPGDFGMMGSRPSNLQLLDWLAVEFRESGWDIKHMYRLMVLSAAYQQSARATPQTIERDPANRLIARGPRFRMDAEELRDCALQSSGLLVEQIGGPSVKPYQPPGIWEAVRGLATKPGEWKQDKDAGTYRRSLYTFWKRQAPPPNMLTFDAPLRDVSCPVRERTDTPLQALVLWNDPQWVEAARMLAQRAMKEAGPTPEERLNFIARWLLSRPMNEQECEIFLSAESSFQKRFDGDDKAAEKLLKVGDTPCDKNLPKGELASWTLVASQILSTDAAMNK